jgi:hypothetical protein
MTATDHSFTKVAGIIAEEGEVKVIGRSLQNGNAPEWLAIALEYFSAFLRPSTVDDKQAKRVIEEATAATDTLMKYLPHLYNFPGTQRPPEHVLLVLALLLEIKKHLLRLNPKRKGRKPNSADEICAAVVVEAWKLIHGGVKARSDALYSACYEYWWACTGEAEPWKDPIKWRRPVERAIDHDIAWIRDLMSEIRHRMTNK